VLAGKPPPFASLLETAGVRVDQRRVGDQEPKLLDFNLQLRSSEKAAKHRRILSCDVVAAAVMAAEERDVVGVWQ